MIHARIIIISNEYLGRCSFVHDPMNQKKSYASFPYPANINLLTLVFFIHKMKKSFRNSKFFFLILLGFVIARRFVIARFTHSDKVWHFFFFNHVLFISHMLLFDFLSASSLFYTLTLAQNTFIAIREFIDTPPSSTKKWMDGWNNKKTIWNENCMLCLTPFHSHTHSHQPYVY